MCARISVTPPSLLDRIDNLSVEVENRMLDVTNPGELKVLGVLGGAAGASYAAIGAADQLPCESVALLLALAHGLREPLPAREV